jgi:hypothetical protein
MILRHYRAHRADPRRESGYLQWLRTLPCVVCSLWGFSIKGYSGWIETAHVGQRGMSQKCPDREALPLCVWHHRMGPHAVHVLGRNFWSFWKLDRYALIAAHQQQFKKEHEKRNAA